MAELNLLYRWELAEVETLASDEIYPFFVGDDFPSDVPWQGSRFSNLTLRKLVYSSPTVEVFEGAAQALMGIVTFIEKVVFVKHSMKMRDLELELKRNELVNEKIATLGKLRDTFESGEIDEEHRSYLMDKYALALGNLADSIIAGYVWEVSLGRTISERPENTESLVPVFDFRSRDRVAR